MRLALLACLAVLVGCVSTDAVKLGKSTYPPWPDDWAVDVYLATNVPVDVHRAVEDAKPIEQIPTRGKVIGRIDVEGTPASRWASVISSAGGSNGSTSEVLRIL